MSKRVSKVRVVPGSKIVVTLESGRGFNLRKGEMKAKLGSMDLSKAKMRVIHQMAYMGACELDQPEASELVAELRFAIEDLGVKVC